MIEIKTEPVSKLENLKDICISMPKVELHAHLNGSISQEILNKLREYEILEEINKPCQPTDISNLTTAPDDSNSNQQQQPALGLGQIRNLDDCFQTFARIHQQIRTPKNLYQATGLVIDCFAADNVCYLELRTTPKTKNEILSKNIYIENVVQAIIDKRKSHENILVKLLISIDRKLGELEGKENVQLGIEYSAKYPDIVCGFDISGDPSQGSITWILPLLEECRRMNPQLGISFHLPEVVNLDETEKILDFKPHRVGHGQFLHPNNFGSDRIWELTKSLKIPMEICITSNLTTRISNSLEDHYVQDFFYESLPFCLSTDDPGVFNTSLSQEYMKFLTMIPSLKKVELKLICLQSVDYIFGSESEKSQLKTLIANWWDKNVNVIED